MRAVQINGYGGSDVLEVNDVAKPAPAKGQILVEVHCAGLNPFDWKIRSGYLKETVPLKFPLTLGGDFAGVVVEVGEGVNDYQLGDEVYGQAIVLNGGSGSFAEYLAANTVNLSRKPKNIDFNQAGALPLAGVSALQALEDTIKLKSGDKILIHGGAGGIGHLAVQMAKWLGAFVAATVSGGDVEFVKSLGADQVINYQNESFEKITTGFDAVFDTVGGDALEKSVPILKDGGILVSMAGKPTPERLSQFNIQALAQNTNTDADHLRRLTKWLEEGGLKVHVDRAFTILQVKELFDLLEKGHVRGKVVLKIKNE